MSLILDALDKADREKENHNAIPDIRTVHSRIVPATERRQLWPWMLMVVGLCLLLALAAIGYLLLQPAPAADPQTPAEPVQQGKPVLAEPTPAELKPVPGTAESIEAEEPAPSAQPTEVSVAKTEISELYQAAEVVSPSVKRSAAIKTKESAVQQQSADEELARQLWLMTQEQMPSRPVKSKRTAEPEPVIDAPMEETIGYYSDTPFLHELSEKAQNNIPTMMYALHQYDDHTVVINKKTFGEGEEIAPDLAIKRILADGILLEYKGTPFKLSALNSWVNY